MSEETTVRRRRNRVTAPEGSAAVRTVHVSSRNPIDSSEEIRSFDSQVFETEPAYVRVNAGLTTNLGDYESLRVDVSISMPCYKEEIEQVFPSIGDKVSEMLDSEVEKWLDKLERN